MQRTIMLLTGAGFELDSKVDGRHVLQVPFESIMFSGGWTTTCRLLDGPVTVLNVMVAQGDAVARMTLLRPASATSSGLIDARTRLLHMLRGAARVELPDGVDPVSLSAGQSLLVSEPAVGQVVLTSETAIVMRLDIDEPVDPGKLNPENPEKPENPQSPASPASPAA